MALTDLTDQNIQDTYQKVVQTDGTSLADGTGSLLPISFDGNNVTISGSLTANEYIVSSSVTSILIATMSGSTEFGNSVDDTHVFTGNITASGNISGSLTGTVSAGTGSFHVLKGNTTSATGLEISGFLSAVNITASNNIIATGLETTGVISTVNITASNNISASGTVEASGVLNSDAYKLIDAGGTFRHVLSNGADDLTVAIGNANMTSGVSITGNVTASGNISASGVIKAERLIVNPSGLTVNDQLRLFYEDAGVSQISSSGILRFNAGGIQIGNGSLYAAGQTSMLRMEGGLEVFQGSISTNKSISAGASITASGDISSSGDIYGNDLISIGELFTAGTGVNKIEGILTLGSATVPGGGNNLRVAGTSEFTSHITASGNISSSGDIYANAHFLLANKAIASDMTGVGLLEHAIGHTDTHLTIISKTFSVGDANNIRPLTASGDISASGTVEADLFVGQKIHIAQASSNISSPTQNIYFYAGSNGLSSNTWNVGLSSELAPNAAGAYTASIPASHFNNIHRIPCGVKNVTLKSHSRIGQTQIPSIWIYTGSLTNDSQADTQMGFAASQSIMTSDNDNVTNGSGKNLYNIDITGSNSFTPNPGHDLIAVFLKNEGTGTQAWRFNYRLDGTTTE